MASEVSSMLRNQVAETASAKEEASILQAKLDSRTRRLEAEKNELQSVLEKTPSPPLKSKEVSSWRSVSLLSRSFYDSGSGKKNVTDLSKSPHGHIKKFHPKKSGRDSSRDLSVPMLIRTIRRLTKEKVGVTYVVVEEEAYRKRDVLLCLIVHQNSTHGAAENVGTAAKSNSIMHEPGSASWTSICWFTCSTSCVFYPVWYFGYYISYAVVASVLLGDAILWHLSVTELLAARRDALQSTVIRLRKSSCNNIEGINSDKSIDSERPSLALRSSSRHSVVQEPKVGSSYIDRNLEHNSSLVVCSSSGLESQGENLSDPRITSMLKRKERHTDCELANLLQDEGLDPNFSVMLKKNGLNPMILALLQRSSLDADREHCDSNPPITGSNDVEDVLPNHISFSKELRIQGLGKWLQLLDSKFEFLKVELIEIRVKELEGVHSDYGDTHEDPKFVIKKPPIPPLAGPTPSAIPSMSLEPMLPAQQAQPYGSGSSQQFLPLGHANVAMSQPSQILFPQPMQQNVKKDAAITEIGGATPSDEKIVELGPLVYESKAEAKSAFKTLLESANIGKAISIIEHDEHFKAVEQVKDPEELSENYVEKLENKEHAKALEEQKRNRVKYLEFLKSCDFIKEYICDLESEEEEQRKLRMIKDFAVYPVVSSNTSGSTAKNLFTDVMDELEKQVK
ncbi:hypothetical protein T459_28955 [Capsicum annuum]|uniref:Uncharacterized protein n=1 Tax=Capsicum annuum TaxID=4072 RepID=A0A2G2YI82_CAPAN|nr:hypothetical protein T459_28955 [Capsicum annuum]